MSRKAHGTLACPGCATPMIPVLGEKRERHFRHDAGEGCAEYFAVLAEEMICRGVSHAMSGNGPYLPILPTFNPRDLSATKEILRGTELDGHRVDVRLVSETGRINIVIGRRARALDRPRRHARGGTACPLAR